MITLYITEDGCCTIESDTRTLCISEKEAKELYKLLRELYDDNELSMDVETES